MFIESIVPGVAGLVLVMATAAHTQAQVPTDASELDSLIARARVASPDVRAARQRADALRARVTAAGARPDPMLGLGLMNVPVTEPGFADFMTMKTVALVQTLPYPGKLARARGEAAHLADAAAARVRDAELEAAVETRKHYYELALIDRMLAVVHALHEAYTNVARSTEARYATGSNTQADVLHAQTEAARLALELASLTAQRQTALARLNTLLDRALDSPIEQPRLPARILALAQGTGARFTSTALDARLVDALLPGATELADQAVASNPLLQAHELEIAAQSAVLESSRRAHLPDFDISVQYGQRQNLPDMLSVMVSAPLPVQRGAKQQQALREAQSGLHALHEEHRAMTLRLRADVVRWHAQVERARTQLALIEYIAPQVQAAAQASTAAYSTGRLDLSVVLQSRAAAYLYEAEKIRALVDFATALAELERAMGREVLP